MGRLKSLTITDKIVALFILSYLVFGLFTLNSFPLLRLDEPWYGEVSLNFLKHGSLKMTCCPLNGNNDQSFFGNPVFLLTAMSIKVFGFNTFGLRFFSFLFFSSFLALSYLTSKNLFNERVALAFVFLSALHPFSVSMSRNARGESYIFFFIALGIYLFYRFNSSNAGSSLTTNPRKAVLPALVFSIAPLCWIPGVVSNFIGLFLVLFYYFPINRDNRRVFAYFIVGLIPLSLVFLYNIYLSLNFYLTFSDSTRTFKFNLIFKLQKYKSWLLKGYDLALYNNAYLYILLCLLLLALYGCFKIPQKYRKSFISLVGVFAVTNIFFILFSHVSPFY